MRMIIAGLAAGFLSLLTSEASAEVPFFNATCPGQIEVHADQGGPVYIDGRQTRLKRFNNSYYEASQGRMTVSISVNPDGTPSVTYTRRGGGNGVCRVASNEIFEDRPARPDRRPERVDMAILPRVCSGEASGEFDVRPSRITTNMAMKLGGQYVVQGWFDEGGRTTFFNCYFDQRGRFVDVR